MDLDVANNFLGLGFDYTLSYDMYLNLREAYQTFENHEKEKEAKSREKEGQYVAKTLDDFLDSKQSLYFFLIRKSIHINKDTESFEEENYINLKDVTNFNLKDVVNFQYINAKGMLTIKRLIRPYPHKHLNCIKFKKLMTSNKKL